MTNGSDQHFSSATNDWHDTTHKGEGGRLWTEGSGKKIMGGRERLWATQKDLCRTAQWWGWDRH